MTISPIEKRVPTELPSAKLYLDDIEQIRQIILDGEVSRPNRPRAGKYASSRKQRKLNIESIIGPETMDIAFSKACCEESCCAKSAVIVLAGQDVCLDHFFAKCYERLDALGPMVRNRSLDAGQGQAVGALLEECSSRTLFICLRYEQLTNLDRSRLMEILLLCGDLQIMLRNPLGKLAQADPIYLF